MNCWRIRTYFTKLRFSLNGGYIVYMELLSGHEKIITKSGISLNAETLNRGFTVYSFSVVAAVDLYFILSCLKQLQCNLIFSTAIVSLLEAFA
jgi:hypothetical protein